MLKTVQCRHSKGKQLLTVPVVQLFGSLLPLKAALEGSSVLRFLLPVCPTQLYTLCWVLQKEPFHC